MEILITFSHFCLDLKQTRNWSTINEKMVKSITAKDFGDTSNNVIVISI